MSSKRTARSTPVSLPPLPLRPRRGHKGDFGTIMILAGSPGMAGAALLASQAAYRSGAGLVHLCIPESIAVPVASQQVCAVLHSLKTMSNGSIDPEQLEFLTEFAEECDIVVAGPGLGRDPRTLGMVRQFVKTCPRPLLLDADALHAFTGEPQLLHERKSPLILTPHPGEMAKLLEATTDQIQSQREKLSRSAASSLHAVVVLKGHQTIVTDGTHLHVNETGNPGMATGGSGDVLAGMIAGLLGQKLKPFAAALLGVHVHGLAGDLAAAELGELSVMATDILERLPQAFEKYRTSPLRS